MAVTPYSPIKIVWVVDTSVSAFGVVNIFYFSHSGACMVICHCVFNLHFPDWKWYWTSFHLLICHLYIFGKISFHIFSPFSNWMSFSLFSFLKEFLWDNSHIIQFTHIKYVTQRVFLYSQTCTTIITFKFRIFSSIKKKILYSLTISSYSSSYSPALPHLALSRH